MRRRRQHWRARGAAVYAFDLAPAIEELVGSEEEVKGVSYVGVDVTSPGEVRRAVGRAAGGAEPLRTVVNCAGVAPSARILGKGGVHDPDLYADVVGST